MIETRRLKNVVIFIQTNLSFVMSRKIIDNIDTSDFVLETKYNTDKTELENKMSDTSGIVKKTNCNTKITELENKIPDISNLAKKLH